jgi:hypothetical protein
MNRPASSLESARNTSGAKPNRICLWSLRDDRKCRRARACRGYVRSCAAIAESWLAAIDEERRARPDFAAMESQIETPEELKAYRAWRNALE